MPHHFEDSEQGLGVSRRHALNRMSVTSPLSMALDTGDADEFTFATAGGFACFCGVCPHKQGETGAG
ncbi:hypothetical protein [Mesorhizobium neociceri]|uniref:Uncharacterized protein n=1 Tax=Mesorhizobium neociceri TaxID=1307853 RepID=A0A838B569_9HYPH|nr:hypothetical protein [Mesorhizobium neociceri]MBA1141151.1 hypothetical protein [Mesorhizobium neociceri]